MQSMQFLLRCATGIRTVLIQGPKGLQGRALWYQFLPDETNPAGWALHLPSVYANGPENTKSKSRRETTRYLKEKTLPGY